MSSPRPPLLATLLLERWASGPRRESLIGDLIEQYPERRSAVWYWRQVAIAILTGVLHDAGQHRLLISRALLMQTVLFGILGFITVRIYGAVGIGFWNWTIAHDLNAVRVLWFGRPHWGQPPLLLMHGVTAVLIGWMIARAHRSHAAAAVWSGALLYGPLWMATVVGFVGVGGWWGAVLFQPITTALTLIGVPFGLLLGGFIGARPETRPADQTTASS